MQTKSVIYRRRTKFKASKTDERIYEKRFMDDSKRAVRRSHHVVIRAAVPAAAAAAAPAPPVGDWFALTRAWQSSAFVNAGARPELALLLRLRVCDWPIARLGCPAKKLSRRSLYIKYVSSDSLPMWEAPSSHGLSHDFVHAGVSAVPRGAAALGARYLTLCGKSCLPG
ncbi:hypothetical protein EVAR_5718_1 [Eumeta japonica]|uniref:Uncharacterized protein n=1 Tax=Eumeta variegata TaxID=151549 RepID=A0A4C1T892_EUMVA|nr:hypothetical protein EVAR_5718_1 [Eumeta japonica]